MENITLLGRNLGERHRHFNYLVNEAYDRSEGMFVYEDLEDASPIDRIFKINLASKLRNVNYIIKNLKDDDMLYVSKALKCKWLVDSEYEYIINPHYLESELYPLMRTTAVTKMQHWLCFNLKDEKRCQQYYQYYYVKNFNLALQFLKNSSSSFVLEQFPSVSNRISVVDFKVLCEKNINIIKHYFDSFATSEELKQQYLRNERCYFAYVKIFLKMNPEIILDITEKYFNIKVMKPFNPKATKFIMKYHKERFIQKPELYAAFVLNFKILASHLSAEESLSLLIKLARDKYLKTQKWYSYKKIEPLIKRLRPEDRGIIKKKLFIDKDFGNEVNEWPYHVPSPPILIKKLHSMFEDHEHYPGENVGERDFRSMLRKRKYAKWQSDSGRTYKKTLLDQLFNQYRVASFDKTLFELRKRLKADSSAQNRQYMMLVLVSRSGGHEDNIDKLFQLLSQYVNEPCQIRATIIRSLVKRTRIWRIQEATWMQMVHFAHGLGLDGKPPEADCIEIIHATVIRQILTARKLDPVLFTMYMKYFSTLVQYGLSTEEKKLISDLLPNILFSDACAQTEIVSAIDRVDKLLDILTALKMPIHKFTGLVSKIESLAQIDTQKMEHILKRLYKARIGRRELFKVNFTLIHTEHSYLNVLRHDIELLSPHALTKTILCNKLKYQSFFRKLSIYFNEKDGLAAQFLRAIKAEGFQKVLARPLSTLIGNEFEAYLKHVDNLVVDEDMAYKAALRANAHLPRPTFNIDEYGWINVKTKAIANKVINCRKIELNSHIEKLFGSKKTVKIGLILAKRTVNYIKFLHVAASIRPAVAFKAGFKFLKACKTTSSFEVWNIIEPLMESLDVSLISKKYLQIDAVSAMPIQIRSKYAVKVYENFKKIPYSNIEPILCYIENLLPNISEQTIECILLQFLSEFHPTQVIVDYFVYDNERNACLYIRILAKYLLLCESETIQNQRFELVSGNFFRLMEIWMLSKYKKSFYTFFDEFSMALRYHEVFKNIKYVNCLPVMKKIVVWMKSILPVEVHFKSYVFMHVNMMYFKAIQKSIYKLQTQCIDENNETEARMLVGTFFGEYIALGINELRGKYFDSVTHLYKDILLNLNNHFIHKDHLYIGSLINGILDHNKTASNILAVYLYQTFSHNLKDSDRDCIARKINESNDTEVQMVLFAY